MTWITVAVLFASGTAAGIINTIVGSGSLVTFPVLVALGYPPVLANVTNNVGVLPGSVSGAIAYRRELKGEMRAVLPLAIFSALGGALGAMLLLILPVAVFDGIVPILIILACILVVFAPWIKRYSQSRQARPRRRRSSHAALHSGVGLTGIYGGYFGAAQGVILLAVLSISLSGSLQRANAYKNVLAAVANGAAAVFFLFSTEIAWLAALIIAAGAILGGQVGGIVGRRLPPLVFRIVIVAIGIIAVFFFYAS